MQDGFFFRDGFLSYDRGLIRTQKDREFVEFLDFCVEGNVERVNQIIQNDANIVNKAFYGREQLPLLYAISFNRYEIVNILLVYTNIWIENTYKCLEILLDEAISYYIKGKYYGVVYQEPYNIKIIVDLLERAPIGVYTAENIKKHLIEHYGNNYIFLVVKFLIKNGFLSYGDFSDFEVLTEEQHNILRFCKRRELLALISSMHEF